MLNSYERDNHSLTKLCPLPNSYIEAPTPFLIKFGDWTFKEKLSLALPTSAGSWKKKESSRTTSISA